MTTLDEAVAELAAASEGIQPVIATLAAELLSPVYHCRNRCGRTLATPAGKGSGYCSACWGRWSRAGFPPEGPPEPHQGPRRNRRPQRPEPAARDLAALLDGGASVAEAASALHLPRAVVREFLDAREAAQALREIPPGTPACRGMDTVLFFGYEGEPQRRIAGRERRAKAVCAVCPVRDACLETALGRPERYGIFGGLTEAERRAILRQRQNDQRNERRRVASRRGRDAA